MKTQINFFLLFVLIFATQNLIAMNRGNALIDSLKTELAKYENDTNKVKLLFEISSEYSFLSPETGIEYGNQGMELAKQLNWKLGQAKHYIALMQNYWAIGEFDKAVDMYKNATEIECELGLYTISEETKLTFIRRIFTYPSSNYVDLTFELKCYLKEVVKFMNENPLVVLAITGHSDNFGTFEQNEKRSRDRADKVVEYLAKNGISEKRLLHNYKGSLDPVVNNDSEEGRRKNRRVEIREVGK